MVVRCPLPGRKGSGESDTPLSTGLVLSSAHASQGRCCLCTSTLRTVLRERLGRREDIDSSTAGEHLQAGDTLDDGVHKATKAYTFS